MLFEVRLNMLFSCMLLICVELKCEFWLVVVSLLCLVLIRVMLGLVWVYLLMEWLIEG